MFKSDRHCQVTGYGCGGFDLVVNISLVDVGIGVFNRMVVRITVVRVINNILIFLDLDCGSNTLLTEGNLIPSATTWHDLRRQTNLIGGNDAAEQLDKIQGLLPRPQLHFPIVI